MIRLILQPLRFQFAAAAALMTLSALVAGVWLTFPSKRGNATLSLFPMRSFPREEGGEVSGQALQQAKKNLEANQARLLNDKNQREQELTQIQGKISAAEALMKKAGATKTPEQEALERLRSQVPTWTELNLPKTDLDKVIQAWNSGKDSELQPAIAILTTHGTKWQQEATKAAASTTNERAAREKMLREISNRFDKDSTGALLVLNIEKLSAAKTDPFLESIKLLFMSGGTRATLGENFTNSVGMEMVWVAEGGFWMGRTEVTSAQFAALAGDSGGSDSPKDGLNWQIASNFCTILTRKETEDLTDLPEALRQMPATGEYGLPRLKQWDLAKSKAEAHGMTGFSDNLYEWSADNQGSGLSRNVIWGNPSFRPPVESSYPLALGGIGGKTAVPLWPGLTGNWNQGTLKDIWVGRLGFRVILIPEKP